MSVNITLGISNLQNICLNTKFSIFLAVMVAVFQLWPIWWNSWPPLLDIWLFPKLVGKALLYQSPNKGMAMEIPSCEICFLVHVVCRHIFYIFHIFAHSQLCQFLWSANRSRLSLFFLLELWVMLATTSFMYFNNNILPLSLLSISRLVKWIPFCKDCCLLYKIW